MVVFTGGTGVYSCPLVLAYEQELCQLPTAGILAAGTYCHTLLTGVCDGCGLCVSVLSWGVSVCVCV